MNYQMVGNNLTHGKFLFQLTATKGVSTESACFFIIKWLENQKFAGVAGWIGVILSLNCFACYLELIAPWPLSYNNVRDEAPAVGNTMGKK